MELTRLSRKQTLWVFALVYSFAILVGAFIMINLYDSGNGMDLVLATLISNVVMTVIVFIGSLITKNSSLYDPYWSVIPIVIILEWIFIYDSLNNINVIFLLIAVLVWGVRLTYNWWKNWRGFSEQDWRYTHLQERAPKIYLLTNFFGIHLIPTLVVYAQLVNAHGIIKSGSETTSLLFFLGFALSILAPVIQFISDKQMYEFRINNKGRKSCIDEGLWKYSRHPNYLGELVFWVGIYLMYLPFAGTLNINIVYPILMIALFLFISIPMMEDKLKDRPGYEEYKNQVSMLIPYRKRISEDDKQKVES